MNHSRIALRLLCTATVAFSAAVSMAGFKTLIVASAAVDTNDPHFTDVKAKLLASGQNMQVDVFNAHLGTPTLEHLLKYDVAFVWSKETFANSIALGNVLADYSDLGGGVVLAIHGNTSTDTNKRLMGRWNPSYNVLLPGGGTTEGSAASLGQTFPCVWISFNLNNVNGGSMSARPNAEVQQGSSAYIPARWSDGKIMAVQGLKQRRIDLGIYPPSSDVNPTYWDATTQVGRLMGNACWGAASVRGVPTNFTMSEGMLFGGNFASILASDDDKLYFLNDEQDPNSTLVIKSKLNSGFGFGTMRVDIETNATRDDLTMFVDMKNFVTGNWETVGSFQSTLNDRLRHILLGSTPSSFNKYLQGSQNVESRLRWVPMADLSASDGWAESVDQFTIAMGLD